MDSESIRKLELLLPYREIMAQWQERGATAEAARSLAIQQVDAFEQIIEDDLCWKIVESGRHEDSWLIFDWPDGFDELLLCVTLCRLVDYECNRCMIGMRQQDYTCSNPNTVFGRIGVLLKQKDREALKQHLKSVKGMLQPGSQLRWNLQTYKTEFS
ncbi:MAG: hypothetical protein AB1489_09070 [Acidobacteriota bacterium]